MVEHLEDRIMNALNLVIPAVVSSPARPPPAPVRRTYGRKRILDPDLLDIRDINMPLKKTRTHATPDLDAKPQPVHTTLVALPTNNPKSTGLLPPGPILAPTSSPIKHTPRWTRNDQDQNALDSPFLEPRRPLARPGLTRHASSRNPKSTIYSRHLSHSISKKRGDPTKDELRRKTSEATTTVSVLGDHSWLAPAPPRTLGAGRYVSTGEAEFSFNPPAESTMAVVRTPRSQIGHGINPGSVTPRANPVDMQPRRKRHDSILSTDSEDEGPTLSVTTIMPLIPGPPLKPKRKSRSFHQLDLDDPDATPRAPSLLEQLRQPRPRSSSVTIRRLSVERADEGVDGDDEMDEKQAPRHDSAVRELTDACASMGKSVFPIGRLQLTYLVIGLAEPSSPSDRHSKPHTKRTGSKPAKPMSPMVTRRVKRPTKPYQLSPRTVYRLSQRPRVDMRIEAHPLSPNEDSDMFATYDFDKGVRGFKDDPNDV